MNYITLKQGGDRNNGESKFNHIRELHHSQTDVDTQQEDHAFNHIRELHHSQTG